jgi:hypothetical protein
MRPDVIRFVLIAALLFVIFAMAGCQSADTIRHALEQGVIR